MATGRLSTVIGWDTGMHKPRGQNLTNVWGELVSQRDATEKLAHKVPAQTSTAHRRIEAASGDTHEEKKDEAHKSSKGHVRETQFECPISHESLVHRTADPG
ncbi:hypothetical protein SKAU_G00149600 [Synaphobranchus kaupii]|uniref:Uncharacterized protein n=1 Tax=Synaphobranchus kaupii TaxID=118154 RepID=A0A9Q1FU86_SYNKA|nr:hypothetical protein SKAU_G00149600 [Synaphobranchus kaupii]